MGGEGRGIYSIIWEIKYRKNDCNNVRRIGGWYKIYAHIIILYIYIHTVHVLKSRQVIN